MLQVARAPGAIGALSRLRQGWEQKTGKNRDDRYDNEQLDERKPMPNAAFPGDK